MTGLAVGYSPVYSRLPLLSSRGSCAPGGKAVSFPARGRYAHSAPPAARLTGPADPLRVRACFGGGSRARSVRSAGGKRPGRRRRARARRRATRPWCAGDGRRGRAQGREPSARRSPRGRPAPPGSASLAADSGAARYRSLSRPGPLRLPAAQLHQQPLERLRLRAGPPLQLPPGDLRVVEPHPFRLERQFVSRQF